MPLSSRSSKIFLFYNCQCGFFLKNHPSKSSVCSWEVEWGILVCFFNRLGHPLVLQIEIDSLWDAILGSILGFFHSSNSLHGVLCWLCFQFCQFYLLSGHLCLHCECLYLIGPTRTSLPTQDTHACANRLSRVWYSAREIKKKKVLECFQCFLLHYWWYLKRIKPNHNS